MVFTQNRLAVAQMDLSATSMTYPLLSTQLRNVEERQEKKIGKSTTLQQDCQRKRFPYFCLRYGYAKSHRCLAAATEHVDQGLSLTLFMPAIFQRSLRMEN